jgi:hypothetical protein
MVQILEHMHEEQMRAQKEKEEQIRAQKEREEQIRAQKERGAQKEREEQIERARVSIPAAEHWLDVLTCVSTTAAVEG